MGRKASDFQTIPLCPRHHTDGGFGIAFHAGKKTWQATYGTERELLSLTYRLLSERGYYPPPEGVKFCQI